MARNEFTKNKSYAELANIKTFDIHSVLKPEHIIKTAKNTKNSISAEELEKYEQYQ